VIENIYLKGQPINNLTHSHGKVKRYNGNWLEKKKKQASKVGGWVGRETEVKKKKKKKGG
jgi:hypothetical protein